MYNDPNASLGIDGLAKMVKNVAVEAGTHVVDKITGTVNSMRQDPAELVQRGAQATIFGKAFQYCIGGINNVRNSINEAKERAIEKRRQMMEDAK